jgi:hypothetical protein
MDDNSDMTNAKRKLTLGRQLHRAFFFASLTNGLPRVWIKTQQQPLLLPLALGRVRRICRFILYI